MNPMTFTTPHLETNRLILRTQGPQDAAARACIHHAWGVPGWDTHVSYISLGDKPSVQLSERPGAMRDPDTMQIKADDPCQAYLHPQGGGMMFARPRGESAHFNPTQEAA
tara:strand:+ start:263 stop:592 length:330 start_codon:yes stop_codon:yes gene_type:complete